MVERALSMGEVEGSMPSFSSSPVHMLVSPHVLASCVTLIHDASDKALLWPALGILFFPYHRSSLPR